MKTRMNNRREHAEINYPVLAEAIICPGECEHSFVVLFVDKRIGTVVHDPHLVHGVGYYCMAWTELTSKKDWRILDAGEEITITQ